MTALDSRTWLAWGVAGMAPLLVARNPVILLQLLGTVLIVRWLCTPDASLRWRWIVRIALVFSVVGVVFNALTVRTGNQVAFHIAGLNWNITWNAIVYGLVASLAMVTLVLTGVTVASGLDWVALSRVLPRRLAPLATAGSVAWSFLPGASHALADIREAQAARGHAIRGARDLLPIVAPLLDTSLSRALTMSEALEVRGFGGTGADAGATRKYGYLWPILLLLGLLVGTYALSLGDMNFAILAVIAAGIGLVGILRTPPDAPATTRYRAQRLTRADAIVLICSAVSLTFFLTLFVANPSGIAFNPYPDLHLDALDFRFVLALVPLLAPVLYPAERPPL